MERMLNYKSLIPFLICVIFGVVLNQCDTVCPGAGASFIAASLVIAALG
jgi:hypothetical protein